MTDVKADIVDRLRTHADDVLKGDVKHWGAYYAMSAAGTVITDLRQQLSAAADKIGMLDATLLLQNGAGIHTHKTMLRVSKRWCERAIIAEKKLEALTSERAALAKDQKDDDIEMGACN